MAKKKKSTTKHEEKGKTCKKKRLATKYQEKERAQEKEVPEADMDVKGQEPDAVRLKLKGFLDSSQFSDFIIRSEDKEFRVHKIVLGAQSEYFSKVLLPDRFIESKNDEIVLKENDPRDIEAMIRFMYDPSCEFATSDYDEEISPTVLLTRIYAVAELYEVPRLKERVESEFKSSFHQRWNLDDFPQVVEEVYSTTANTVRGLRDEVVRVTREHIVELLKMHSFQRVLEKKVDFSVDMVRTLAQSPPDFGVKTYNCSQCGTEWQSNLILEDRFYCMGCGYSFRI